MTAITITGALTMLSNNGDGPQLLTEAAEFLNALAQMGVQMAVEINLRPVGAEKTEPAQAEPPVDSESSGNWRRARGAVPFEPGDEPAEVIIRRLRDGVEPYPAPVDFTPAAPAQPEEPQWDLTPHVVRMRGDDPEWRKLTREQRVALLNMEGRTLAKKLGHAPTMQEWDASKPAQYPSASGVSKYMSTGWTYLAASWEKS